MSKSEGLSPDALAQLAEWEREDSLAVHDSILMTVYNRPRQVLRSVLFGLAKNDLSRTELVIVNDGSDEPYNWVPDYCDQRNIRLKWVNVDTQRDRPGSYGIGGYNNPSYAWNSAIEASSGYRLVFLSSDCIPQPQMMAHARRCGESVWQAGCIDMDTGTLYLGKERLYPMGWCMALKRKHLPDGGYDEGLLKGIDYDDNDFTARCALNTHTLEVDLACTVFHQSHPSIAYSDGHLGSDINERYMRSKWGGIPWIGGDDDPLEWQVRQRATKLVVHVEKK